MSSEHPSGGWWQRREALEAAYHEQLAGFRAVQQALVQDIDALLSERQLPVAVKGRVKTFPGLYHKLLERSRTAEIEDPFTFLTDTVGLRVVAPFLEDVGRVEAALRERFAIEETDDKGQLLSVGEFGYSSTHLLMVIPDELRLAHGVGLRVVEVQLRTTLQEAWAEVEHELVYKADVDMIDQTIRRKLLALNATLSLADTIFQELRNFQRQRFADLQRRHQDLMDKVSTLPETLARRPAHPTPTPTSAALPEPRLAPDAPDAHLSGLLVRALQAHVDGAVAEAVALYSSVLAVRPTYAVYNHRGLAYIALSDYDKAAADFTAALELAPDQARAYTNRGIARRMAGRLDEAMGDLDRSLELDPMWPDTLYARALTLYDLGNIPGAIRDCDRAIAIRPEFKQVLRFKRFIQGSDL